MHLPGQAEVVINADPSFMVAAEDGLIADVERLLGRGTVAFALPNAVF